MTNLVACIGEGTGTWTNVLKLASNSQFQNSFLIVNEWTRKSLQISRPNIHLITIDSSASVSTIRDQIASQLKGKIMDFEVALNIDSGTGKEHAAVITALMRVGLSFRLVTLENEKVEEITYDLQVPTE